MGRPRKPDDELTRPRSIPGRPRGRPKKKPPVVAVEPNIDRKIPSIPKRPDMTAEEIATTMTDQQFVHSKHNEKSMSMAERQARTSERVAEQMELLYRAYQNGRVDLNDTEDVFQHGMTYMRACIMKGHLPSMMEYAVTMGWTWGGVKKWTKNHPESETTQIWNMFQDAWTDLRIGMGLERVTDNVLAIYLANNSGTGLSNNPVTETTTENPLGERVSAEEIKEKYKDLE